MRADTQAPTIRLSDYRPPAFLADAVELTFTLHPTATRVKAKVAFRRNPAHTGADPDLRLDGRGLKLVSAAIDGVSVPQNALAADDEGLTVAAAHVPEAFTWEAETEIAPEATRWTPSHSTPPVARAATSSTTQEKRSAASEAATPLSRLATPSAAKRSRACSSRLKTRASRIVPSASCATDASAPSCRRSSRECSWMRGV